MTGNTIEHCAGGYTLNPQICHRIVVTFSYTTIHNTFCTVMHTSRGCTPFNCRSMHTVNDRTFDSILDINWLVSMIGTTDSKIFKIFLAFSWSFYFQCQEWLRMLSEDTVIFYSGMGISIENQCGILSLTRVIGETIRISCTLIYLFIPFAPGYKKSLWSIVPNEKQTPHCCPQ